MLCCAVLHDPVCLHMQAPDRMVSPSASPQGQGSVMHSPAALQVCQQSSPHHSRLNASDQSQELLTHSPSPAEAPTQSAPQQAGNESDQHLSPAVAAPTSHAQLAAQHAQHAGQGNAKHGGNHWRQGPHQVGQPHQQHVMVSMPVLRQALLHSYLSCYVLFHTTVSAFVTQCTQSPSIIWMSM